MSDQEAQDDEKEIEEVDQRPEAAVKVKPATAAIKPK